MLKKTHSICFAMMMLFILYSPCSSAEGFEEALNRNHFDMYFQRYAREYFGPHFDWRYFKAQAIAESRLHPQAHSEKGARGVMQILPSTFQEIVQKNTDIQGQITEPGTNIAAGIFYNRMLWEEWHKDRSFRDRLNFMFASYNAGKLTILKAQKIAIEKGLDPYSWHSIAETLPAVNGDGSRETITYVDRIHKIKEMLYISSLTAFSLIRSESITNF